jgi:glycosyltransferase involved in cell wall biosynthesis
MRFSIVITCHNQLYCIQDAVDSALSIRTSETEIIVVDDASNDGSRELLRRYGNQVQLLDLKDNKGAGEARNLGASIARGDYLVFLDGDDVLLPWALDVYERVIALRRPQLILCRMLWFEGTTPSIPDDESPKDLQFVEYRCPFDRDRPYRASASALVVERRSFCSVGGWSGEMFPLEDHDLTFKLGQSARTVQICSPATSLYRWHLYNTFRQVDRVVAGLYKIIQKESDGRYPGGSDYRFRRYALIGGLAFFLSTRCIESGRYRELLTILKRGWPMILSKIVRSVICSIRASQPLREAPGL